MFPRIWQMMRKEFIQVLRDPRMRTVIFVIPCVQTLIIGYAVSADVRHVPTGIYDLDNTPASRELLARFVRSGYFDVAAVIHDDRAARTLVDRGTVGMVLHLEHGYADDLAAGRTARIQVIVDGSDSNTAAVVLGYVGEITNSYGQQVYLDRFLRLRGATERPARLDLRTRAWFNANLESRNFFVPGVIVIVVSIVSLLLTSMAIVREKEIGTMEQLLVTPITAAELILGKTLPFALVAFIDVTVLAVVGTLWFDVPLRGSIPLLYAATALYLLTTLGVGLWISTVSQTQQQAMMSTFLYMFPAILLSGFAFPIENMPAVLQWTTYILPLRYYLVVLRGIFLRGVGFGVLWPEIAAMAVLGAVTMTLAIRRFHKTL